MKIKNVSKNTIFVEDIDLHIPYDDSVMTVPSDLLKRSRSLRNVIISDFIEILEHDDSQQIEKSVFYLKNNTKAEEEKEEEKYGPISSDIEVKIHGIFYEAGGYAKVNRYLAKNLSSLGIKVKVSPKKGQNHLNFDELQDIVPLEKTSISRNHISIDSIIPSFSEMSSSKYRIIYTTVESYTLPQQFIDCCDQYNEIWATSPFGAKIIGKYIKDKPIFVIPTGVDPDIYNESVEPITFSPQLKKFVFLSVFGWSYRKGYDLLFKSYFDAFSDEDDVSLLILSRYMQSINPAHNKKIEDDISRYKNKSNLPQYKVVSKIVPENIMPQIYRACDAFVLPSRGEGSNLTVCEASLCGLPVISTNVSGQTLYLEHDNSFLIEPDGFERLQAGACHLSFWDGQEFPILRSEKCVKDFAGLMRQVYENYSDAKNKNKRLQELLLKKFKWMDAAKLAAERLDLIRKKL